MRLHILPVSWFIVHCYIHSGYIALSVTVTDDELKKTWKEVTKS